MKKQYIFPSVGTTDIHIETVLNGVSGAVLPDSMALETEETLTGKSDIDFQTPWNELW